MEFLRPGQTNINFAGNRGKAFFFSLALIAASIISLVIHGGPRYGIDFAGGTIVQIKFKNKVSISELRKALSNIDIGEHTIQNFGEKNANEFLIRTEKSTEDLEGLSARIARHLEKIYEKNSFEIRRVEMVGPKVGKDLKRKGMMAVIYAIVMILVYIAWRFKFKFAVGAVAALVHDVIITVGALSIANKEFTLPIIAAILTIVGYSLNDTIVIYDRIRENLRKKKRQRYEDIINISINETLSRTILTSLTTLFVVVALFTLGGGIIHDFAFALLVGVIIGTYSSIFVASPIVIAWENRLSRQPSRAR